MDPADYGIIRGKTQIDGGTRYFVASRNRIFEIDVSQDKSVNNVCIIGASDLRWTDNKLSDDSFKREIGKATLYFLDGEIVLLKRQIPAKPFTPFRS